MAEAPDYAAFAERYEAGQPSLVELSLVADLETPVAAFLKLRARHDGPAFLLESVEGGAVRGRYSMIGLDPDLIWRCRDGVPAIARGADLTRFEADEKAPLASLRALIAESAVGGADGRDCRRWRRACSVISATTWFAPWSGCPSPTRTRSAYRTPS
jgi:anthranilate synthase component I